jgi:hypothetical protein
LESFIDHKIPAKSFALKLKSLLFAICCGIAQKPFMSAYMNLTFKQVNLLPFINPFLQVSINPENSKLRIPLNNTSKNQLFQLILNMVGENTGKIEILLFQNCIRLVQAIRKANNEKQNLQLPLREV